MGQYNLQQYGTSMYNAQGAGVTVFSTELLVIDDLIFTIADNGLLLQHVNENGHRRDISQTPVPRADGYIHNNDYFRQKPIVIRGLIQKDTQTLLEEFLDLFKFRMSKSELNIDITRVGLDGRRFVGTLVNGQDMLKREPHQINICPFELIFRTHAGQDRVFTVATKQFTTSPQTHIVSNDGSATAKVIAVFVVNAEVDMTTFKLGNDTNNGEIEITPAGGFSAGDVLIIDHENFTVTLNSVAVDFSGTFPFLDVGSNTLRYTTTGTSWDIRSTIKYKQTYQ